MMVSAVGLPIAALVFTVVARLVAVSADPYPAYGRWYASDTWIPPVAQLLINTGGGFHGLDYQAKWQADCNLVLYRESVAYWSTDTAKLHNHLCYLAVQRDANLVIYGDNSKPIWASNSAQSTLDDYYVELQTDGNLVIYTPGGDPIWATGTNWW